MAAADAPEVIPAAVATAAWDLHQRAIALTQAVRRCWVELGQVFLAIEQQQHYRTLGYASFEEYLAQPELGYSRTQVYRMLRGVGLLHYRPPAALPTAAPAPPVVTPQDLVAIGIAKADVVAPLIRAAQTADEAAAWVATARELSYGDLQLAVREARGRTATAAEEYVAGLARSLGDLARALVGHPQPSVLLGEIERRCQDGRRYLAELARHPEPAAE